MTKIVFPLVLLATLGLHAQEPAPYTHKIYDDLVLSRGVTIDDPNRLVLWQKGEPVVLTRSKDTQRWKGDAAYWQGEFVESDFPYKGAQLAGMNVRCSKHIRIVYGNQELMTEEYVLGNLRMFEECLKLYYLKMGFPVPFESTDPAKRDGIKRKVDIFVGASNLPQVNGEDWFKDGGNYGCYDGERGFGWLYTDPWSMRHTPPSGATPHELAHACQMHAKVFSPGSGFWWEAHANWMMLQFINDYPTITNMRIQSSFYMGHGRHYYDCWQIFEHLKDEPGFGYDFVTRLWSQGDPQEYIWKKAEKLAAPRSMADEWGKMARRSVTWDYARGSTFRTQDNSPDRLRFGYATLEPIPFEPNSYRVPAAMAPQQFGYNICPLKPTGRVVTVNFTGYSDLLRGSGWRASLVAVSPKGRPRYSPLWQSGVRSMNINPDDKLYLVVAATPNVMEILVEDDYRSPSKAVFPYRIRLTGAVPLDLAAKQSRENVPGKQHINGGGFVADTATVDATAYVGPNARVLGNASVLDSARLEDSAVVTDNAVIRDNAVVSGCAMVRDNATVSGQAHITDYAIAYDSSVVTDKARLTEYAAALGEAKICEGGSMRGRSATWGGPVGGHAILEGDYANALKVTKGAWCLWFVNTQEMADAATEPDGIQAQFLFQKLHPYWAWDTYGLSHGWLVGNPRIADGVASFNGSSQYIELKRQILFQPDLVFNVAVRRTQVNRQVTLAEFTSTDGSNRLTFGIAADGKPFLSLTRQGQTQTLTASKAVEPDNWTDLSFQMDAGSLSISIDAQPVATSDDGLAPWDLKVDYGLLGRSREGQFYAGDLSEVTFLSNSK